jgi:hypothetical protein
MTAPATFRYNGVLDLLCDAVFHYRLARACTESYPMNRHARASVLGSALALESAANSLLLSLELGKKFAEELDRLPVLAKFDAYLRLKQTNLRLDRGRSEVQRVQDLVSARNDYVHPKVEGIPTEVSSPQEQGDKVQFPLSLTGETWKTLKIPKRPMFWSADDARSTLSAAVAFLTLVVRDLANLSAEEARYFLHSRLHFGEAQAIASFDEFVAELRNTSDLGLSFEFLGI